MSLRSNVFGVRLAFVAALGAIGCSLITSFDGLGGVPEIVPRDSGLGDQDASMGDDGDVQTDPPSQDVNAADGHYACGVIVRNGDLRTQIPRLTAPGGQTVDGIDDEFCDIAAASLTPQTAQRIEPDANAVPGELSYELLVRAAWSDYGLHFHFHVEQSSPVVASDAGVPIYLGDTVELYVKGDALLSGDYEQDAGDRYALHLAFAAPPRAEGARYFTHQTGKPLPENGVQFAVRSISAYAYEVEVQVSWQDALHSPAPQTGDEPRAIGFDFSCDYLDRDTGAELGFALDYCVRNNPATNEPFPLEDNCSGDPSAHIAAPYCDDRTWCTPSLMP
jgi:hypothetical protein